MPSGSTLEKLVTVTVTVTVTAASLAAGIWQLSGSRQYVPRLGMYPAWALLPREAPSAEQIRHETYWSTD